MSDTDDSASSDVFSEEKRSEIMSRVRSEDTSPELRVRSTLHRLGFRFRLHRRDLPGSPDIVLPKYRTVVFVHGCFWHRHPDCKRATLPRQNREFWRKKLSRNVQRDEEAQARLKALGWRVIVLWTCELRCSNEKLSEYLSTLIKEGSNSRDATRD